MSARTTRADMTIFLISTQTSGLLTQSFWCSIMKDTVKMELRRTKVRTFFVEWEEPTH